MDLKRAARFWAALFVLRRSMPTSKTNAERTAKNASESEELRGFYSETVCALDVSTIYKFRRMLYAENRMKRREKQDKKQGKEERI
jgi:hypothetical protein